MVVVLLNINFIIVNNISIFVMVYVYFLLYNNCNIFKLYDDPNSLHKYNELKIKEAYYNNK